MHPSGYLSISDLPTSFSIGIVRYKLQYQNSIYGKLGKLSNDGTGIFESLDNAIEQAFQISESHAVIRTLQWA